MTAYHWNVGYVTKYVFSIDTHACSGESLINKLHSIKRESATVKYDTALKMLPTADEIRWNALTQITRSFIENSENNTIDSGSLHKFGAMTIIASISES